MEPKLSPKRFNMLHLASVSNQIFGPGEEPAGVCYARVKGRRQVGFRRASSSSGWAMESQLPQAWNG